MAWNYPTEFTQPARLNLGLSLVADSQWVTRDMPGHCRPETEISACCMFGEGSGRKEDKNDEYSVKTMNRQKRI